MKFCSECAHPVTLLIPEGDNRPRYVCSNCGTIHYQNPKMVLGSIPVWDEDGDMRILPVSYTHLTLPTILLV